MTNRENYEGVYEVKKGQGAVPCPACLILSLIILAVDSFFRK